MTVVVAVDGPAGSGKSSVSRAAAALLGFAFLDTGAAYRALAWQGLEHGSDLADEDAVLRELDALDWAIATDPAERWVRVGREDVGEAIRSPRVSAGASLVARVPGVRTRLNDAFRRIIADAEDGIVVEGRDITTVVAPDADVRVLLTASPQVRAARRAAELDGADTAEVLAAMLARDQQDRETIDFMAAQGITVVDSSELSFADTVAAIVRLVEEVRGG